MYRPTVRMADVYQDYIEKLNEVTHLDRNQLIRLAIFAAAYSDPFKEILNEYKKADVHLPTPPWELYEDEFFLEKEPKTKKGRVDAHADNERKGNTTEVHQITVRGKFGTQSEGSGGFEQVKRRRGEIPTEPIKVSGGNICFTFD